MRIAVYTDYAYSRRDGALLAERAFVLFLGELAHNVERLVLLGRLRPAGAPAASSHYRVDEGIDFVPLPHYDSLADPVAAAKGMAGAIRAFWRSLDDVDAVWLLGPHPLCLAFAAAAAVRRKRVFLGVRQNLPVYARARHPRRRAFHLIADTLEGAYRLLARICPTVVVGPDLARHYAGARRLLALNVSLIRAADVRSEPSPTPWEEPLRVLTVGRLETEKNPLMLADVLARLAHGGRSWELLVCGEGPLSTELAARLEELGVAGSCRLLGYVPVDSGLLDLYRSSHAFLHVSWTEGVPQVLFEAFAAGIPVVATAVGGVEQAAGDAALLIPPGQPEAAAESLERLADDPELRERLARKGLTRVAGTTLEAECDRLVTFFAAP